MTNNDYINQLASSLSESVLTSRRLATLTSSSPRVSKRTDVGDN